MLLLVMNGTANLKFNTKGVPKINGSVIPKRAGTIATFPVSRYCLLFARSINNANPKPIPLQVMIIKNA